MQKILISLALLVAPASAAAQSNFTRVNPAGPHRVGLRVVEQYDFGRGYRGLTDSYTGQPTRGERARPIQTLIWYPADPGAGRTMTAGDYVRLGGTSDEFPASQADRERLEKSFTAARVSGLPLDRARAELSTPMLALRDAVASSGKFPVVIYAPSYRAPAFENADLCEYLASQGYVVIASPSIGQTQDGMTDDLEGAETQLGDIQFLISFGRSLSDADTDHLAVVGYSWGGLANVMAAAKDSRIDALVALDGSVRSYPDVIEQSRFLTPDRITIPMLYVAATPRQMEDTPADMNEDRSFLNKLKYSDLYRVTLAPYVHGNFSVMGQRFLANGDYGNYDKDELSAANGWLESYVLHFLDGYLKGDPSGRAFLNLPAAQIGAPRHMLTVYTTRARASVPTRAAFAAELARHDFEQSEERYRAWQKQDSSFELSEVELNEWGYKLLRAGEVRSSIAILRLNVSLHAQSWNAFDSLGEAYALGGNRTLAIQAYRKSLALNRNNKNAADRLATLELKP